MQLFFFVSTLFFLPIGVNRLALFLREATLSYSSESIDLSESPDTDETFELTEVIWLGLTYPSRAPPVDNLIVGTAELLVLDRILMDYLILV